MEITAPKGMDRQHISKLASKYDPDKAREVRDWILALVNVDIGVEALHVEKTLKDGIVILQLLGEVFRRIPELPATARGLNITPSSSKIPFKMMENIEKFLTAAKALGVPGDLAFNTGDLYDGKNMTLVISTLLLLGSEAQRYNMQGPTCGPKPTTAHVTNFTDEQLRAGEGIIGLQAGTNKLASQKGMGMGKPRLIHDPKNDLSMCKEGEAILSAQSGYNKGATQAGMRVGPRHISDIPIHSIAKESEAFIGLQAGYAEGATQSGLSFGAPRQIQDQKSQQEMAAESHAIVGLQAGSNQGATQTGLSFAAPRQIAGAGSGEDFHGKATLSSQYGYTGGATQSGMNIGKTRKITDK